MKKATEMVEGCSLDCFGELSLRTCVFAGRQAELEDKKTSCSEQEGETNESNSKIFSPAEHGFHKQETAHSETPSRDSRKSCFQKDRPIAFTAKQHLEEDRTSKSKVLVVQNFARKMNKQQLFNLCGYFGEVMKMILFKNKGKALVQFKSNKEAQRCKENLDQ